MRKQYTIKIISKGNISREQTLVTESELETKFIDLFFDLFTDNKTMSDLYAEKEVDITADFVSDFNKFMKELIKYAVCEAYQGGVLYKAFENRFDCINPLESLNDYYTRLFDTETDIKVFQDRVHAIIDFIEESTYLDLAGLSRLNKFSVIKTELIPDPVGMTTQEMIQFIKEKTGLDVYHISCH